MHNLLCEHAQVQPTAVRVVSHRPQETIRKPPGLRTSAKGPFWGLDSYIVSNGLSSSGSEKKVDIRTLEIVIRAAAAIYTHLQSEQGPGPLLF